MARGKYKNKNKHKVINHSNNSFPFKIWDELNEEITNEIRKFDKEGEVENGYKEIVKKINFEGMAFFDEYKNTIPNHILGRLFVSYLDFRIDMLKDNTQKTKKQLLNDLGFNSEKVGSAIGTSISIYPTPASMVLLKQVADSIDYVLHTKREVYQFGLKWPVDKIVEFSFERFYRVSHSGGEAGKKRLKKRDREEPQKNQNSDLEFLKQKSILINKAETIEEIVTAAEQVLKLAEILGG